MALTNRFLKRMLLVEVIVCFGPLLAILLFGLLILPAQIVLLLGGVNTLQFLSLVIGGLLGVAGIALLLREYYRKNEQTKHRLPIIACLIAGIAALAGYMYMSLSVSFTMIDFWVFFPPLLCTIHVLFVTRAIVFGTK